MGRFFSATRGMMKLPDMASSYDAGRDERTYVVCCDTNPTERASPERHADGKVGERRSAWEAPRRHDALDCTGGKSEVVGR